MAGKIYQGIKGQAPKQANTEPEKGPSTKTWSNILAHPFPSARADRSLTNLKKKSYERHIWMPQERIRRLSYHALRLHKGHRACQAKFIDLEETLQKRVGGDKAIWDIRMLTPASRLHRTFQNSEYSLLLTSKKIEEYLGDGCRVERQEPWKFLLNYIIIEPIGRDEITEAS